MLKAPQIILLWFILLWIPAKEGHAQYFGKNKPSYQTFDFNLAQTDHFDIYHYLDDSSRVKFIAELAEQWYNYHRQLLTDTFASRNPLILYRNHADFQQTTAIMSNIGVGTGGVTESLKRRIVMPFSFSDYQTAHVLGHEMVHAFQYHIIEQSNELNRSAIMRVPLWMIEGMAEYLSIGNTDAFTSVWMRDALLNNDFPSFDTMSRNSRYSPYRFGQAFWSYIATEYGEQYIKRLFVASAQNGYKDAINDILGISPDSLFSDWKTSLSNQIISSSDSTYTLIGERFLTKNNSGRYNLSPSVSPNGKYLVFLSERDIYSLDLFLANTENGEIVTKIYTSTQNNEIDALEFTENAGTWSPDNRFFAFVAYEKGRSVIWIYDIEKQKLHKKIDPPSIDAITSPAWSPGGQRIAFSGMTEGTSNLYSYSLHSENCKQITHSPNACMQPSWSNDGQHLWFVTDEASPYQTMIFPGFYNIARIELRTSNQEIFRTFPGARNLNPVPVPGKNEVFFLSNVNGRRDLYSLNHTTGRILKATDYATGIMGITEMSPALSIGPNHLYYSMLWKGDYQIIRTPYNTLLKYANTVHSTPFDYRAARLSPYSKRFSVVDQNLIYKGILQPPETSMENKKAERNFKLDYVGNMGAGVMTGRFGTGMAGSIEALFSDVLGHNVLYSGVSINGEIYDFGGQVALLNQKRRIKIGASLSHIPYRMGYYTYEENSNNDELVYYRRRVFEDKAALFSYLPFNRNQRIEAGISMAHYGYRYEKIENVRTYYPTYHNSGTQIDAPDGFWVGQSDIAYVFDNSNFGLTSPVDGARTRIQVEKYYNGVDAHALLLDYRKYKFIRPFSLAFRLYHYGRYGPDRNTNRMSRLFVGYPWLVRGYDTGEFYADSTSNNRSIGIKHLLGSNLLVSNLEWRMPLSGPIDFAWIRSSIFFSELAFFLDAGLAWNKDSSPVFALSTSTDAKRIPVFSTGMAVRLNFFGFVVIEPYLAFPYHQEQFFGGQFGFNVIPGW